MTARASFPALGTTATIVVTERAELDAARELLAHGLVSRGRGYHARLVAQDGRVTCIGERPAHEVAA